MTLTHIFLMSRPRPAMCAPLLMAFLSMIATFDVIAQTMSGDLPPPVHTFIDANGINLIDGSLNLNDTQVSVGEIGHGGLSRVFFAGAGSTAYISRDSMAGTINSSGSTYTVSLGGQSLTYSLSGAVFTSLQGDGSTLTQTNSTTYTLVMRNGTTAVFSTAWASLAGVAANVARITTLTLPSGEIDTYTYRMFTLHVFGGAVPLVRIDAVTNNLGYEIKYFYKSSVNEDLTALSLSQVIAINNAVDYCAPSATTCTGLTVTWPSITFNSTNSNVVTDSLGRQTTYPSIGASVTTTWIRPSGETITLVMDASSRITSFSNGTGTWTYSYVDVGSTRTTTVTDPLGHTRVVVSNPSSQLVSSDTDGLGHKTIYSYDAQGRLTKITRPKGDSTNYSYDTRGNRTQTTIRGNDIISTISTFAGFDVTCANPVKCNQPNWIKDGKGQQTDFTYNATTGQVTAIIRPAGANLLRPETDFTYTNLFAWYKNSAGTIVQAPSAVSMLTKISQCATAQTCPGTANAIQTVFTYGTSGVANNLRMTKSASGSGDGVLVANTQQAYDSVGNLFTRTDPLGNVTRFRFNVVRQLVGLVGPDPDAGGPLLNRALRLTYQPDGLVIFAERGTVTGQLDSQWAGFASLAQVATTYDGIDRKTLEKQTNGTTFIGVTQYSYDAANRTTCVAHRMNPAVIGSLPASACTLGTTGTAGPDRITAYTYDNDDKVTKVTVASGTTLATDEAIYTYGSNEEVQTLLDGKGNKTTIVRDPFNRVSQIQFPTPGNGSVSSTTDFEQYTYDNNNNVTQNRRRDNTLVNTGYDALNQPTSDFGGVSFTYDNLGRMLTASVSGQTLMFGYNGLNQQVSEQGPLGTITRQFNLNGLRKQLKYPDNYFVNYGFDAVGEMISITDSASNALMSVVYDNLGRVASVSRAAGQGPAESLSYGSDLRLSSLAYTFGDATKNVTYGYTYNLAGQPITATVTATNTGYKNMAARTVSPINSDGQNKYTVVGAFSQTYDNRANLTNTGLAGFTYDGLNRMATSGANTLTYDALSRLYQVASTRLQYDGEQIIAEYDNTGALAKRYIPDVDLDRPLISFAGTGTTVSTAQWFLANAFGSVVALGTTGASNTTSGNPTSYDEFGLTPAAPSWRFQYKGMPYFSEIGLYHARARVYSQYLGRFMQPDPSGYSDGMNLYSFVHNSPINRMDPIGLGVGNCPNNDCTLLDEVVVTATRPPPFALNGDFLSNLTVISQQRIMIRIPTWAPIQSQADADRQAALQARCHEPLGSGRDTVSGNKQRLLQIEGMTGSRGLAFLTWLWNVAPYGAWDYKTSNVRGSEDQGNFHFGATGTIYFSPTALFRGGGAVRIITHNGLPGNGPYFDDVNDHDNIQNGIDAGC